MKVTWNLQKAPCKLSCFKGLPSGIDLYVNPLRWPSKSSRWTKRTPPASQTRPWHCRHTPRILLLAYDVLVLLLGLVLVIVLAKFMKAFAKKVLILMLVGFTHSLTHSLAYSGNTCCSSSSSSHSTVIAMNVASIKYYQYCKYL